MPDLSTSSSMPPPGLPDRVHSGPSIERLNPTPSDEDPRHSSHERVSQVVHEEKSGGPDGESVMQSKPTAKSSPASAKLEQLRHRVSQLSVKERSLNEKYDELGEKVEEVRVKLKRRTREREELKGITQELAVAEKFLTTADRVSQAEVIRAMEALNGEIYQLTSIVADKVQVESKKFPPEEVLAKFQGEIPQSLLSKAFLDVVLPGKLEDTLAIEIGWQAILSYWCRMLIGSWDFTNRQVSRDVDQIYKGILSRHGQRIAGRWRSLTLSVTEEPSTESRKKLMDQVIISLTALPALCGYIHNPQSRHNLNNAFRERLSPLLDKCLEFRKTAWEGITSMDVRSYIIDAGAEYDSQRADLEYEDERGSGTKTTSEKKGVVACTLGLGLFYDRKVGEDESQDGKRREVILKPKVIMLETLKSLIS